MPTKQLERKQKAIKIERGVPLPKYTKMPAKNDLTEDLKKMKAPVAGEFESRLIDIDFSDKSLNAMRTRIHEIQKRESLSDRKFTVNVDPIGGKKLRVWRLQ